MQGLRIRIFIMLLCCGASVGCAAFKNGTTTSNSNRELADSSGSGGSGSGAVVADKAAPPVPGFTNIAELEKIIADNNPLLAETDERGEKVPLHIPLEINQKVAEWVDYFTVRDRERTIRFLERGHPLMGHIQKILKENDVPPELFYLAMIESGFVTHAKSHARAVGVWQFMKGTGKNYGLAVNSNIDERRNWIKATEAAATYLKDLNNVFGSWYLALAAYNAGENRIVRSIMKGKTRDFWALAEAGMLPKETLNYVPKFLAAQIVGKNLEKYNLRIQPQADDIWEDFDSISVPSGVSLRAISKAANVSYDTLKRWNEDLVRDYTPYSKSGTVEIYVPKNFTSKIADSRTEIEKIKRVKLEPTHERGSILAQGIDDGSYAYHVVQRGESLYTISKQLGISVRTLMKINGVRHSRIHPGQRIRYYKVASSGGVLRNTAGRRQAVR